MPSETTVNWRASWIRTHVTGGPRTVPPASYLRREFVIEQAPARATLHITALGLYEAQINGAAVGDQVFAPGWTEYRRRVAFQSYDVTSLLKPGPNAIGVILGDGWYSGHIGWVHRQFFGRFPQLLAQLELTLHDGKTLCIASDETWRASTGPILENDLLMGESYDARLELGAWSSPGYDDSGWPAVTRSQGPGPTVAIEPSVGPVVRRVQRLTPIAAPDAATAERWSKRGVFDLGQNFAGRVQLCVKAAPGRHLTLRHAEILDANGELYTDNLRSARATDQYTCASSETETWEPRFTFHGFRYVQVQGLKPEDQCSVEGVVLHSDMPVIGAFECSHPLLNQLQRNIVWGLKSNFLEVPTDCPQRDERLGWTGDAQVFIRTAAFNCDVRGFFRKWLQTVRDNQSPQGAIPPYIPHLHPLDEDRDGGPAWADAAIICPWQLYLCYGDADFLRDNYPCMTRYLQYLAQHKVKDFIRAHPDVDANGGFGDWLALDGSGTVFGGTAKDLIGTALYAHVADIVAKSAAILGKRDDERQWRQLHGRIAAAFAQRYVTADGLLAGGTQTAYVLALHFHLVPQPARATAARQLVRLIENNQNRIGTGFVGTPYILHVLEDVGRLDIAYRLLEQEEFPSWLFNVKLGATTMWERWDGWTPQRGFQDKGMNSFNHYAYGAVGDWMVSTVAGLQYDEQAPGYEHTFFKPRPGGSITQASARLQTPFGEAAIRWQQDGPRLNLQLTVPQRGRGTLALAPEWTVASADKTLSPGTHQLAATRAS
jgi:alpha-L-rhamnosidase